MPAFSSYPVLFKRWGQKHKFHLFNFSAVLLALGGSSLMLPIPASWAMPISVEDVPAGSIPFGSTTHRCNNFLVRPFTVNDNFIVGDISLGLNISHGFRGAITGFLQAPSGSFIRFLNINGGDTNDNYDVLFEEGGGAINDGNNDDVSAPFYDRSVNPSSALSALAGNSSQGTWTLFLCDGGSGLTGTYNRSLLTLSPADISGSVFDDVNENTVQDSNETVLANIGVSVYQDDGDGIFEPGTGDVLIDSRQTQTNGDYAFGGLANGSYWIEVDETDSDLAGRTYGGSTATGTANPRFVNFSGTAVEDIDFPFIQDLQNLCEVGDPDGQLAFLSGATLESGVDLQIGAVYRFANVFENVDALVEVSAFNGGATLGAIDNDSSGVAAAFQPTLNAVLNTTSSVDFDITFVARGTTAPVAMTFRAAGVDIDGNGQQLREFIELTNLTSFSLSPDTTLVDSVVPSGNRFESNTTDAQPGVSATALSTLVSTEYISVSQLRYRIGAIDAGSTGANQRLNSLFFGCTDGPDTPVTFDYGDAPDTYGTDEADSSGEGTGARHFIVNGIHLGTAPDAETDGQPSADATGDGADEDGITLIPLTAGATEYTIPADNINATNTGTTTLHAWVDFDQNGTFESTEYASVAVTNGTPASGLTWNGITVGSVGSTFARFRLTSDSNIAATTPDGAANDGEVEDYQVEIAALPTSLPPRSCPSGTGTFDWSAFEPPSNDPNWPNGSLGPEQFTVNGVQYTFEFRNPNNHNFTDSSPRVDSNNFTDNNGDPALYFRPDMTDATPGQYVEVHITARDPDTGNLLPITGFQGIVDDVDQNNSGNTWQDEVVVTGYLGGTTGTAHLPTLVANNPSNVRVVGNIATGITNTNFSTGGGPGASVDFGFGNQPIDTLVIRHRPGPDTANHTSAQHITFNNWTFCLPVTNNPNVLLTKRITRVNGQTTNGSTALNAYIDASDFPYDDNTLDDPVPTPVDTEFWPTPDTFLLGAINGGETRPGDEIEYTIYFLSTGDTPAIDVQLCDRIPSFQTFVPDAFNSVPPAPNGGAGANRGISVEYDGDLFSFTNDADGDTARFYPPGSTLPAACNNAPAQSEDNGAIVVNLGDLPQATGTGTPATSFGAVRFRATVN